jgi:hypothetical protein
MRKLIVPVLLAVSFGAVGGQIQAQTQTAPDRTDVWSNGRAWSQMDELRKTGWVEGYAEGFRLTCNEKSDKPIAHFPWKLSVGEIMRGIDHFYENTPESAPVPLFMAVTYVALKANGSTESQLDTFAANARKIMWAAPQNATPQKKR